MASLRAIVGTYRQDELPRWEAAWQRIHAAPSTPGSSATALLAPRQLPRPTEPFVGRGADIAKLDRLATPESGSPVIVCVTGMGGIGKTELVVQWARGVADRFPDGCLFMNLRGFDHQPRVKRTDALLALIHELGGGADVPRKRRNRETRYRTLIAGRRMLLIFDNVRDAQHVQSLIPPTDSCVTVVTSRDDLTALHALHGARRIALRPLPPEAARDLFGRMAGMDAAEATPMVAGLVDGCAGHPLALRLAGGLVAGRTARQVAGHLGDLGRDGGPLRILRAGPGRADLNEVFAWSYRSLDDGPARAFRLLAAHPGRAFGAEAVAALAGAGVARSREWLEDLRHANLVHDGDGAYGMHDLLREHARRIARPDERAAALERLLDHYLSMARTAQAVLYPGRCSAVVTQPAITDGPTAREWLDHERPNLVAAVVEAARIGDAGRACALADALWLYLHEGGHFLAATVVHGHAADAAGRLGRQSDRALALDHLGIAYQLVGDYPSGLRCLTEALELHRSQRDRRLEGRTRSHLGALEARCGHYPAAVTHLAAAVVIADEVGDVIGAGNAVNNLGLLYQRQGRDREALPMLDRAVEMAERSGNAGTQAIALNNRSLVLQRLRRYDEARRDVLAAKGIVESNGSGVVSADILDTLGALLVRTGELPEAEQVLRAALAVHRDPDVHNRAAEGLTLLHLGELRSAQGRPAEGLRLFRQALSIADTVGEQDLATGAHLEAGHVLCALGRWAEAAEEYAAAHDLALRTGNRNDEATALVGTGRVAEHDADPATARQRWESAYRIYCELGLPAAEDVRQSLAGCPGSVR